jgi:NAD(P)-dependent dehydrogenase (short-subunit alcohol dehydrogenase family)
MSERVAIVLGAGGDLGRVTAEKLAAGFTVRMAVAAPAGGEIGRAAVEKLAAAAFMVTRFADVSTTST